MRGVSNKHCLLTFFIIFASEDPDEMLYYAAFHLGLHCLPKYLFVGTLGMGEKFSGLFLNSGF